MQQGSSSRLPPNPRLQRMRIRVTLSRKSLGHTKPHHALSLFVGMLVSLTIFAAPAIGQVKPTRPQVASRETLTLCTALIAWSIDHPPEGEYLESGKASEVDFSASKLLSKADLRAMLVPAYLEAVPVEDPWKHRYEVFRNTDKRQPWSWGVRSLGPDGSACSASYLVPQPSWDRCNDIVRVDGELVAGPEAPKDE
jgi:hypothetical protein